MILLPYFQKAGLDYKSPVAPENFDPNNEALNLFSNHHLRQMISSEAYNKAMKHQFKMFWKEKKDLNTNAREKVAEYFKASTPSLIN